MGLGNKAPSALNLEFPGAGHVTRFAAPAECVVDSNCDPSREACRASVTPSLLGRRAAPSRRSAKLM
jgi:hypothetical protein